MTYHTIDDRESTPLLEEGGLSMDGTSKNVTSKTGPRYSKRCRTLLGILAAVASTTATVAFLTTHHSSRAAGVQNPIVSTLSSVLGTGRKRGESCDNIWWNACGKKHRVLIADRVWSVNFTVLQIVVLIFVGPARRGLSETGSLVEEVARSTMEHQQLNSWILTVKLSHNKHVDPIDKRLTQLQLYH